MQCVVVSLVTLQVGDTLAFFKCTEMLQRTLHDDWSWMLYCVYDHITKGPSVFMKKQMTQPSNDSK